MTDYRRAKIEGGYYFFTVVTYKRRKFLTEDLARDCLRTAWRETQQAHHFDSVALCLLPDHLHCIWKLPEGDCDFSGRWSSIKASFTREYLSSDGQETIQGSSRSRKRERGIWQRRFWEHQIRDESDLQRHIDYIHYNPVKHGLVKDLGLWPWSSYHRHARDGVCLNRHWDDIQDGFDDLLVGE